MKIKVLILILVFTIFVEAKAKRKNVKALLVTKLEKQLDKAVTNQNCLLAVSLARGILEQIGDNLKAYRAIANCTKGEVTSPSYKKAAKEVFEQSKVLSIIPKILDIAHVKEMIPVLSEVKTDKSVGEYLMLTELYSKIGEPEKQIKALEEAVALDPNDPRPKLILAYKKFEKGKVGEARKLYREYFFAAAKNPSQAYMLAYVAALAFPYIFSGVLTFLCWILGYTIFKKIRRRIEKMDDGFKRGKAKLAVPLLAALIPIALSFQFITSGKVFPFGLLLLIIIVEAATLLLPKLYRFTKPVLKFAGYHYKSIFSVRFSKTMSRVPKSWRIIIAFLNLFVLGTVTPIITQPDIKYGVMLTCLFIFLGTIGSLVVTFVRSNKKLETSLKWICVTATIPFLVMFILSKWNEIGAPILYGRLPSPEAIESLVNYLVFWCIAVYLALHLSKIVAEAIIDPLREIIGNIRVIEKGDFTARVDLMAENELGLLGKSINHMAAGLERREFIEKTFHRYVDPQVANRILENSKDDLYVESQRMDAVIMFVDIRGFTSMSERITPEEVVAMLNQYFEAMVSVITSYGGVIDKFIGDAILAVWGVPTPIENAEESAVKAGIALREKMEELNIELKEKGFASLGIGIGINSGPVVAGSIGNSERMEYTVIGDVVNTAQRIESIAKKQEVLLSESVYSKVSKVCQAKALDPVKLKGKEKEMIFWAADKILMGDNSING